MTAGTAQSTTGAWAVLRQPVLVAAGGVVAAVGVAPARPERRRELGADRHRAVPVPGGHRVVVPGLWRPACRAPPHPHGVGRGAVQQCPDRRAGRRARGGLDPVGPPALAGAARPPHAGAVANGIHGRPHDHGGVHRGAQSPGRCTSWPPEPGRTTHAAPGFDTPGAAIPAGSTPASPPRRLRHAPPASIPARPCRPNSRAWIAARPLHAALPNLFAHFLCTISLQSIW